MLAKSIPETDFFFVFRLPVRFFLSISRFTGTSFWDGGEFGGVEKDESSISISSRLSDDKLTNGCMLPGKLSIPIWISLPTGISSSGMFSSSTKLGTNDSSDKRLFGDVTSSMSNERALLVGSVVCSWASFSFVVSFSVDSKTGSWAVPDLLAAHNWFVIKWINGKYSQVCVFVACWMK